MTTAILSHADTDTSLFRGAIMQTIRTVERLAQNLYRYGAKSSVALGLPMAPSLRIPIPQNPRPEVLTYESAREMISVFQLGLSEAEAILANITAPHVQLRMHIGTVTVDIKGNGAAHPLWMLMSRLRREHPITQREGEEFYIKFDRGDVHWFRGYCHLLMGLCDWLLAHDWEESFNFGASILFSKVQSPYARLKSRGHSEIIDIAAMVHSIHWKVTEQQRMLTALHHFEMVPAQSKESWEWIMKETEDDHEWLPNPRQTGVFPGAKVTGEMVVSWQKMMAQGALILAGEVLVPFWRGDDDGSGINVRKLFTEPGTFDLINWVHGCALMPYLESGKAVATRSEFREVETAFGRNLPLLAIWFN